MKVEYEFDIKNNTVIKIPPSYYNDASKNRFTYYLFRFNISNNMPEYIINEINNFIHNYISIESLSDLNKNKLKDETFF